MTSEFSFLHDAYGKLDLYHVVLGAKFKTWISCKYFSIVDALFPALNCQIRKSHERVYVSFPTYKGVLTAVESLHILLHLPS